MKTYIITISLSGIETLSFDKISEALSCFDDKVANAKVSCNIHILFTDGTSKCSSIIFE